MQIIDKNYINGEWVKSSGDKAIDVINPANEEACAQLVLGTKADVEQAVQAAKTAFESFSQADKQERLALLDRIIDGYKSRMDDIANAISLEMGAPLWLANGAHAPAGLGHFMTAREVLENFEFEQNKDTFTLRREPIGVCGFITPWNWPINQIACKLGPALATGCTVVWKPSEVSPLSANILMEILDDAGVPKGVVNLVHGDGPEVGAKIASAPGIDMVSFTGSTKAGILVAQAAAPTVKRVTQELGGKSPNVILNDLDEAGFAKAVSGGMKTMTINSGQNCNAPSRMLVPKSRMGEAIKAAAQVAENTKLAPPDSGEQAMGPVVSEVQYNKIQSLIETGIKEGAKLVAGGTGRPNDLNKGYYVRPTVFANVDNNMTIAREEIFGPVLCIIPYNDEEDAIKIANDTDYGLSAYVSGADDEAVKRVAGKIRAGMVHTNGAPVNRKAPFGGYKQSGNGREWGEAGFEDFLETKAVL